MPAAPGPRGSNGTFDGGYAQVIRATDYPVAPANRVRPPHPARPARPAAAADADVFVYRDTSGQPDGPAADFSARDRAEHDSDYWYSLLAEDATPRREETRGPFEPLLPYGDPPSRAADEQPAAPGAGAAGIEQAGTASGQASPGADQTAQARARKLEQLKDLYLTAEAIGEQNVDKHFDQLLAQQRQLISEYFRQSSAAGPAEAGPVVASPRDGAQEGADVAAEPPRGW